MKLNKILLLIIIPISALVILVLFKENLRSYFKISYRTFYNVNISYDDIKLLEKDLNIIYRDYKWKERLELTNNPN